MLRFKEFFAEAKKFAIDISDCGWATMPPNFVKDLQSASTPKQIEQVIAKHEGELAQLVFDDEHEKFLYCDHAAEIMSAILGSRNVEHFRAVGTTSDNYQSHSYIVVQGKPYDPTDQGFGDRSKEELYPPDTKFRGTA